MQVPLPQTGGGIGAHGFGFRQSIRCPMCCLPVSYTHLAELIKREVGELEGVDRIDLYGKRPECINISLLQDRMANLGVKQMCIRDRSTKRMSPGISLIPPDTLS